jgi:5-methylcytosine-specific restriction protein B
VLNDASDVLNVVPQIVLQGPPGTGKTYAAKRLAARLLRIDEQSVTEEEKDNRGDFHDARFDEHQMQDKCWQIVQFHPAYGYDDFIRGIQAEPTITGNSIDFKVVPRVLDKLVRQHKPDKSTTVLIIDEINRANLAQVLGELIYSLEYRGSEVETPYAIETPNGKDSTLRIPPKSFYIIGTMNTADRSIGRIDYAVRRRFAFLQLSPEPSVITEQLGISDRDRSRARDLFNAVAALFVHSASDGYLAPEFHRDDVQVGHTYFLGRGETVRIKFAYQVYPLLREYFKDGILVPDQNEKIELALPEPAASTISLRENISVTELLSNINAWWQAAPDANP